MMDKAFENIHSKVLINLTDKRKEVNESALRLIDKMRMIFDNDYLVARTLNVVDVKNPRAKIACFEFLASVIKDAKAFSNDSKLLRKCIRKCMLYLSQNSSDTNFIGPILSILLCIRDMNCKEISKILTSGILNFTETETLEKVCSKYAPDLLENISHYKKKLTQKPSQQMDRTKYCKSIDQIPKQVLAAERSIQFKSKDFIDESVFKDITNFTPEGYCSISLKNRVYKLKTIAKRHIKSQSEER
jgi:hypothetical protein